MRRLQRSKVLAGYQYLGGQYLITLDGSEYFNSESVDCSGCLVRRHKDRRVEHHHHILQPALVRPGCRQVLPLAPEFIRRQDGQNNQDCETNAGKRVIRRIRREYRQLRIIIVADSLYSTMPFVLELMGLRLSFLLVAKPDEHKSLYEDIEGLRRTGRLERFELPGPKGQRHLYEWVNEVSPGADPKSPVVNFVQFGIFDAEGKQTSTTGTRFCNG